MGTLTALAGLLEPGGILETRRYAMEKVWPPIASSTDYKDIEWLLNAAEKVYDYLVDGTVPGQQEVLPETVVRGNDQQEGN